MELEKLKAKKEIVNQQIKLLQIEKNEIDGKILDIEYPVMSWDDLEDWLKKNREGCNYEVNPTIIPLDGVGPSTHCRILQSGELQVGPYYHTDHFPRGKDVRVHYKFKPWR